MTILVLVIGCASPAFAQTWEQRQNMPGTGRHHPVTFSLNGYGYATTGSTTTAGFTDDFYRYDPVADSWEVLPDFTGPDRSYSYGGAFQGKAYLGFGSGTSFLADLWEYDPETEGWKQLTPLPGTARTHPAFIITDDGKIFVGTGGAVGGNLRDWWEYDIASNQWTRRADFPGPTRHHPFYFNIGNVPYVGFGHGAGIYRDFYRFNRDNTWTRMADFPGEARVAGTQFSFGGKGYILSGEGVDHQKLDTGEFWEYDPLLDQWTELAPHPGSGRWAPGTFLIGNMLYFMAGTSTLRMESDMWRFAMTTPVGTESLAATDPLSITLYPNPLTGRTLNLRGPATTADFASIRLLSVDGRQIGDLLRGPTTIEMPGGLAAGHYYVAFSTKEGAKQTRQVTVLR